MSIIKDERLGGVSNRVYPVHFEQKTGFDQLRKRLKSGCLSSLGREKVDGIAFQTDYVEINRLLYECEEMKHICLHADDFPLSHYYDVRPYLEKIRVSGSHLSVLELFELKRSLETLKGISNFFKRNSSEGTQNYPYLSALTSELKLYPYVYDQIDSVITTDGSIRDHASSELQAIRKELVAKESAVSKTMGRILHEAQAAGWVDGDTGLTIREGKMLLPVSRLHKRRVKGFIQDESSTGKTVYIEPIEMVELNNAIRELVFAERRELIRVLRLLSDNLRPYLEDLLSAYDLLGVLDMTGSKARLSIDIEAVRPQLRREPFSSLYNARHPLLFLAHRRENKPVIPLNISIDKDQEIILISGPNAGGKSVCLKTVGLLQYMVQCGLLIPAGSSSCMGIYDRLFIDIGDEQSIEDDLSTYSSHLMNMKYFLAHGDSRTLVLIDEFGAGTEPLQGASIAEAILECLNTAGVKGVINTHYTNLKHFASRTPGMVNGAMLFDMKALRPRFVLETGRPGSSFAFEIAGKIGLPEGVLSRAGAIMGSDYLDFEHQLQELQEDRCRLREQRVALEKRQQKLDRQLASYNHELEKLLSGRKALLSEARREARSLIDGVNKRIERTIFEIRESQADREQTKAAREELQSFIQAFEDAQALKSDRLESKIEKVKRREAKRKEDRGIELSVDRVEGKPEAEGQIAVGDRVRLKGQTAVGEVLGIEGQDYTLSFGQMRTTVSRDRIEKVSGGVSGRVAQRGDQHLRPERQLSERRLTFSAHIDVRGKRGDEALELVRQFVDEAIMLDAKELRILHGTGSGILRQIIREYLSTVDLVRHFGDEKIQLGGAGITVIELE